MCFLCPLFCQGNPLPFFSVCLPYTETLHPTLQEYPWLNTVVVFVSATDASHVVAGILRPRKKCSSCRGGDPGCQKSGVMVAKLPKSSTRENGLFM